MNKQELAFVVLLFAALLGWMMVQARRPGPEPEEMPGTGVAPTGEVSSVSAPEETVVGAPEETAVATPVEAAEAPPESSPVTTPAPVPADTPEKGHEEEEIRLVLENERMLVTLTSWGGAVASVELKNYRSTPEGDSGPVLLDFSETPALSVDGVPGLSTNNDFTLSAGASGNEISILGDAPSGLRLRRTVRIGDGYRLEVKDTLSNETSLPVTIPARGLWLGPMKMIESKAKARGLTYLGLDTLPAHGGEGLAHWGRKLPGMFGYKRSLMSCQRPDMSRISDRITHKVGQPVSWAAAKNKFFVQIMAPEEGGADCELVARRNTEAEKGLVISTVAARMIMAEKALAPGEAVTLDVSYYVGPKKYAVLKLLGNHQADIMEFGFFTPLCRILLSVLNAIHRFLPNYGVAIILLTALVRIVFWPITHKSTESMKKMQAIQPQVTAIREKYKSNPQKMNQEVMALYKEHKVNPMSGCLPILVQIPVFIALFTVLRSAVELRFSEFLWIQDLSEPEGLLAGVLPVPLNILPLVMTATMVWQQRLTPTAGDSQQQKMMVLMPVVMLFIFYNMASALVLYWTTSQCLAIVQLLIQKRKRKE